MLPLLLLALPAALPAQEERGTISVDVNLVVLHVTVRDLHGGFVSDLHQDNFRVLEDGHPQSIRVFQHEDVPVSVGLVVNNSTSMYNKRADVIQAAKAFVRSSNPADELFVINFNEKVSFGLPPAEPFSNSVEALERALNVPIGGRTALYDAIDAGLSHFQQASRDKKVLIVFSDGGDNNSNSKLSEVLDQAAHSNVIIYTIGLFDQDDQDSNPGVLRKIARMTGGECFLPQESKEAVSICERIAADIRHQYTIGYVSSNQKLDNSYRRIQVIASKPHGGKLLVRAREGYIAGQRP